MITGPATDALVAEITLIEVQVIDTVAGIVDPRAVVALLGTVAGENQVAVAIVARTIAIVAVLHRLLLLERHARDAVAEREELRKEWFGEIEIPPMGERIPVIAPPRIDGIDRERFIRGKCGNHLPPRQIALAMVEVPLIAIRKSANHPTEGAQRRIRNVELMIERLILGKDRERSRTLATDLLHHISDS